MLNLTELMDIGCAHTVTDSDGWMYPCGKPIVPTPLFGNPTAEVGCTRAANPLWQSADGRMRATGKASAASASGTPNRPVPNSCR